MARLPGYTMTTKHRAFCREYLVDHNATRAAIRAGYSPKTAYAIGYQLLQKTGIRAWLDRMEARAAHRSEVTLDRVMAELAKIGFSNVEDFVRVVNGKFVVHADTADRDHMAAVREVRVDPDGTAELKLHDKTRALIALGEHVGLKTRGGRGDTPINVAVTQNNVNIDIVDSARTLAFALEIAKRRLDAERQSQQLEAAE